MLPSRRLVSEDQKPQRVYSHWQGVTVVSEIEARKPDELAPTTSDTTNADRMDGLTPDELAAPLKPVPLTVLVSPSLAVLLASNDLSLRAAKVVVST